MFSVKTTILAALSVVSVAAGPVKQRQACEALCGDVCYYADTVQEAVDQGYGYYQDGTTVGSNDYPHTFNNYEGFDFSVSGPYQEFPITDNFTPYTGGDPGPDRVVFNESGAYAGAITHTGAEGNNFVECT